MRKACADVFMPVSCVCSAAVRQSELAPLFVNLLRDQSRWVRMAAFQALGPFISTFADASITAMLHNDNGEIVITDTEQLAVRLEELEEERRREREEKRRAQMQKGPEPQPMDVIGEDEDDENEEEEDAREEELSPEEARAKTLLEKSSNTTSKSSPSSELAFNNFNFWREPLPAVELDDGVVLEAESNAASPTSTSSSSSSDQGNLKLSTLLLSLFFLSCFRWQCVEIANFTGSQDEEDPGGGGGFGIADEWSKLPIITFQTFDDLTSASSGQQQNRRRR